MASKALLQVTLLVMATGFLGACDSTVQTATGGSGGSGGDTGGSGGGMTTGTGTGGGMTTGGAGGGMTTGTGGGTASCDGLDQVACLGAYPACVPIYDDTCCPTCDPGPCGDCTSLQFHHCAPKEQVCGDEPLPCGLLPDWACAGGQAKCLGDPGGSPTPCGAEAGCAFAECSPDYDCNVSPVCVPVTKDICGPILCDAIPPACPDGMVNEVQSGCFTSFCIPGDLCTVAP